MGVERVPAALDPTLNVDPTRDGVEPDIAFTGANDAVPWVVWYEENASGARVCTTTRWCSPPRARADTTAPRDRRRRVPLDRRGQRSRRACSTTSNSGGICGASVANEAACSLNANPAADAEDPRVAAGTMDPANPTVPWVAWDERRRPALSRCSCRAWSAAARPLTSSWPTTARRSRSGPNDSTRPDITFSGNTPYVTWREDGDGVEKGFVGHFVNAADPTFVLDETDIPLTPTAQADVREPISSSCTANPFNQDGAACQGAAVGTPFFLFTNGRQRAVLFADAYQPARPSPARRRR